MFCYVLLRPSSSDHVLVILAHLPKRDAALRFNCFVREDPAQSIDRASYQMEAVVKVTCTYRPSDCLHPCPRRVLSNHRSTRSWQLGSKPWSIHLGLAAYISALNKQRESGPLYQTVKSPLSSQSDASPEGAGPYKYPAISPPPPLTQPTRHPVSA